jgi:hypothetical protein
MTLSRPLQPSAPAATAVVRRVQPDAAWRAHHAPATARLWRAEPQCCRGAALNRLVWLRALRQEAQAAARRGAQRAWVQAQSRLQLLVQLQVRVLVRVRVKVPVRAPVRRLQLGEDSEPAPP